MSLTRFYKHWSRIGRKKTNCIKILYNNTAYTTIPADLVTINELKEPLFSLKTNKSPGYDEVCLMSSKISLVN